MHSEFEAVKLIGGRGREPTNKLPPGKRRSRVLGVRLTEDEYERVCAAASDHQLSASAYLAAVALGTDLQMRVRYSIINELRRQGSLLKLALVQATVDDVTRERLRQVLGELKMVIRTMGTAGAQS